MTLLVGSMGATASAAEPDWCQGYQPWGAAGAKAGVTVNNLKDNINDVGPGLFWIAANVGCEFPKDAKAQQEIQDEIKSLGAAPAPITATPAQPDPAPAPAPPAKKPVKKKPVKKKPVKKPT